MKKEFTEVLGFNQFRKKINMGDCSVEYFDKKAFAEAIKEAKPKRIPKGKKLILDPFVGYILIDK